MAKKGYIVSEMITDDQLMFQEFIQSHVERTYIANKTQYIVIPAWKVKMPFKWHKNRKVKLFLE